MHFAQSIHKRTVISNSNVRVDLQQHFTAQIQIGLLMNEFENILFRIHCYSSLCFYKRQSACGVEYAFFILAQRTSLQSLIKIVLFHESFYLYLSTIFYFKFVK